MTANRSPERLAADATGNFEAKHLTEPETVREPLSYLRDGEQPHYFFSNMTKGLRLEHPDWDEKRTPYNIGWMSQAGDRYLLVTDQRLLFLAGEEDAGDVVVSLPYEELTGSDANWAWGKARLSVDHRDGRTISFFDNPHASHIEDAGDYVASRIAEVAASGPTSGGANTDSRSGRDAQGGSDTQVFTAEAADDAGDEVTDTDPDGGTGADAGDDIGSDTRVFSATTNDDSTADTDVVNFCPACGHDLQSYSERRFCASCGHRIA